MKILNNSILKNILILILITILSAQFVFIINNKKNNSQSEDNVGEIDQETLAQIYKDDYLSILDLTESEDEIYYYLPISYSKLKEKYGSFDELPEGSIFAYCSSLNAACYYWIPIKSDKKTNDDLGKLDIALNDLLYFNPYKSEEITFEAFATALDNECIIGHDGDEASDSCKIKYEISERSDGIAIIDFDQKPFYCEEIGGDDWREQLARTIKLYFDKYELQINGEEMTFENTCCWCGG